MANNPYVNKVQKADGTVLIDISDTTAVVSDVASGKYFYTANGAKVQGTATGSGAISVVDTSDSHGGVVRTITAVNISDTTAVASDVASGKYFYTADGTKTEGILTGAGAVTIADTSDSHGGIVRTITAVDISDTTATASDVANGKYFYTADGTKTAGTGGSSSMNVQTNQTTDRRSDTSLGSINSLTCSKAGTYDVYWTCTRSNTSQTWGSQLYIGGSAYGTENTTWSNNVQTNHLTSVAIANNATVAVYGRSRSGYYIYAPQLTIVQTA